MTQVGDGCIDKLSIRTGSVAIISPDLFKVNSRRDVSTTLAAVETRTCARCAGSMASITVIVADVSPKLHRASK